MPCITRVVNDLNEVNDVVVVQLLPDGQLLLDVVQSRAKAPNALPFQNGLVHDLGGIRVSISGVDTTLYLTVAAVADGLVHFAAVEAGNATRQIAQRQEL